MLKKAITLILSVILLLQLVSCSNVELVKNVELEEELIQLDLHHEYDEDYGNAIYKIYDNNEFKGKKFNSIKELCSLIAEELTKKDSTGREYSFKYEKELINEFEGYTLDNSDGNTYEEFQIAVFDTKMARKINRLEFSKKTITLNVEESKGFYRNYFYNMVLNDYYIVDGLRVKKSDLTEITSDYYVFGEHIFIELLCGDYHILVNFFPKKSNIFTKQDIYEIFGIENTEIEEANKSYISPLTQITISKNLSKDKIINYIKSNDNLTYGYGHNYKSEEKPLIFGYNIHIYGDFYNDENTLIILDKTKHGICVIDYDINKANIPYDTSGFINKGLMIKFDNAVFYASNEDMLEILPYICEE